MNSKTLEGILYPKNFSYSKDGNNNSLPRLLILPRKSWNYIESELKEKFKEISTCEPTNIFVFSYLRNGKIGFDDDFTIYTDSDCPVESPMITKSDDVCSEEFGCEILNPFFENLFPNAKVNQFLTPEKNINNEKFFSQLWDNYKSSIFIISQNESEDPVWPEHPLD